MNEKRIQEVIEIEKQADEIFGKAVAEAEHIPQLAEQEARIIQEKARSQAEKEAQSLLVDAQTKAETERILNEADKTIEKNATLAKRNFERATTYIISRVIGRG